MALEDVRLLLVRPLDHVVAAARLTGFQVAGDTVTAGPGGGRIELILPPQATGETVFKEFAGLAEARLSGPSRVSYQIAPSASGPFTVEGILALAAGGVPVDAEVELPWRLHLRPRPTSSNDTLLGGPPPAPLLGGGGAAGLWHLRLEAASGLSLVPLGADKDSEIVPPLDDGRRERIVAEGSPPQSPPTAPYVDLSPLGGTLSARGTWPTFSWQQETVLGRDLVVRTESKGFLYPWGHRAVLIEAATRLLLPPDGAQATAGLRELRMLVIPDPVRHRASGGEFARSLPFDEVEVLQPVTELGGEEIPEEAKHQRPAKRLEQLRADAVARREALQAQEQVVADLFVQRRVDIDADAQFRSDEVNARLGEIGPRIDELVAIQAAFDDFQATHPPHPEPTRPAVPIGPDDPPVEPPPPEDLGPPQLTHEQVVELTSLQAEVEVLVGRLQQIEADRVAQQNALRTEDDLAAAGGGFADAVATVGQMRIDVPAFETFVKQVAADADQVHDVFVWPHAKTGERLMLPLRCDDLRMRTPVLFLHDLEFEDNDDFPEFKPLGDPEWITKIGNAWTANAARRLPVPGIATDLVRTGPRPQPADVLPVHELTISGRPAPDGGFRAVIDEAKVALRAVGELVPDLDGLARVKFDPAFLRDGVADKVALRLTEKLGVDFSKAADKAGGLISPVFKADVLSRLDGPVDARALPGFLPGPPDLAAAFADATILGIPLGSLVDNVSLPKPLSIVVMPDGGATMSWKDLKLKSHGPFQAQDSTTFELTVVRSPAETLTRCKIENFTLVLPPGGDLVQLHFKSLMFLQKPGHPPDLDVKGLKIELGGDLSLLKTLQDKVDFGSAAPTVRSTPNGMKAGYALAVPKVESGMFIMKNIAASVGVEVPFDGQPIVTTLAFASRENPFNLTVSVFGGGGYLVFEIAEEGIRKLEASLDFGASVAISVGVAKAEVHALGGVRFLLQGTEVKVTGFLRIGGSIDVLGLVSVSVELRVELSYDGQVLTGRATAVIEIDVTFWSGSIHLDSGQYTFAGAAAVAPPPPAAAIQTHEPSLDDWQKYRDKFGAA